MFPFKYLFHTKREITNYEREIKNNENEKETYISNYEMFRM